LISFDREKHKHLFQSMGYDDELGATLLLRIQLIKMLKTELENSEFSRKKLAELLGVKQPRISEIYSLQIDKFSAELLVKYLFRLGKEVTLNVADKH